MWPRTHLLHHKHSCMTNDTFASPNILFLRGLIFYTYNYFYYWKQLWKIQRAVWTNRPLRRFSRILAQSWATQPQSTVWSSKVSPKGTVFPPCPAEFSQLFSLSLGGLVGHNIIRKIPYTGDRQDRSQLCL